MVPYNLQDMPSYSRLLQGDDDDSEPYFFLDDLKPVQSQHVPLPHHNNAIYYDLQPAPESTSSSHLFPGGTQNPNSSKVGMEISQVHSTRDVSKKRKSSSYQTTSSSTHMFLGEAQTPTSSRMVMEIPQVDSTRDIYKKRKSSSYQGSDYEDDTFDDSKSAKTDDNKKHNHSEIEKRRRDKMNTYILELATMVPICNSMARKADKLTILRMAVQHIKTISGTVHSYTEGQYNSFLTEQELKKVILQASEGFLFVVACDRARLLYVSESITKILNYTQGELLGKSWLEIVHPKDVQTAKVQLSTFDLAPRDRFIDAKTFLPLKTDIPPGQSRMCSGSRRSFFCRMKCNPSSNIKEEADTTTGGSKIKRSRNERRYIMMHCVGYLKSWVSAKDLMKGQDQQEERESVIMPSEGEGEMCSNLSCLVAVGRVLPTDTHPQKPSQLLKTPALQFFTKHASDGKFIFCDERITLVLGFLPQDLVGTSMYEYFHQEDIPHLAELHKTALYNQTTVTTQTYRFRSKNGYYVLLQSVWKPLWNPWTKEFEFFSGKSTQILEPEESIVKVESSQFGHSEEPTQSQNSFDVFCTSHMNGSALNSREMTRLITSHIEASKIGRQIAEEVMDLQRRDESCSSPVTHSPPYRVCSAEQSQVVSSVLQDLPTQSLMVSCNSNNSTNSPGSEINTYSNSVRNNVTLSSIANDSGDTDEVVELMVDQRESPQADTQALNNHGNDEAAMAVIMSLLEADAGLGGPVDFTGLPWPLP